MDILKVKQIGKELNEAFLACCQNRSNYELTAFNVFDHETPQRQFKQCLDELVRKVATIGRLEIAVEELEDKIDQRRQKESDDTYEGRSTKRKRRQSEIDLWETRLHLEGQLREFETLYSVYEQMPHFTAEEIQAADGEYHRLRKTATAQRQIEAGQGIDPELLRVLCRQGIIVDNFADNFQTFLQRSNEQKTIEEQHANR